MRRVLNLLALMALLTLGQSMPLSAQAVRTVDPDAAMREPVAAPSAETPAAQAEEVVGPLDTADVVTPDTGAPVTDGSGTYKRDDVIGAAEGVFGKGAKGLAGLIENILRDQGEPNAYISGREASGAVVVGLRYGSGTMTHKVEGQRAVYWTGPSVGFDLGGDAAKVFVLVYNLYDGQELYRRYPQVEGHAYYVGGFSATYMRRGNVVIIPIRVGAGLRLGANVGYMKFSEKSRWLPF